MVPPSSDGPPDVSRVDADDVAGDVSPGPYNGHGTPEGAEPEPECYYGSLGEFATWLLDVYRRSTRGHARVFCPEWWKHPEAVARMDALWRAFEQLRQDPGTGMSVFWRDHTDHHMSVLLDADGPFKGCEESHSDHPLGPIHQEQPPAVLFERDDRGLPPITAELARAGIHAPPTGAGQAQESVQRP
jgi:Domain of unknown function (DUF4913)